MSRLPEPGKDFQHESKHKRSSTINALLTSYPDGYTQYYLSAKLIDRLRNHFEYARLFINCYCSAALKSRMKQRIYRGKAAIGCLHLHLCRPAWRRIEAGQPLAAV